MNDKIKIDYNIRSGIYSEFGSINVKATPGMDITPIMHKILNKHKDLKNVYKVELLDIDKLLKI